MRSRIFDLCFGVVGGTLIFPRNFRFAAYLHGPSGGGLRSVMVLPWKCGFEGFPVYDVVIDVVRRGRMGSVHP